MSVSEVQEEEGLEEKNWGKGEGGREGSGLEGAVEDRDERPGRAKGGKRKFGLEVLLAAMYGLRWDVLLESSPESVSEELS